MPCVCVNSADVISVGSSPRLRRSMSSPLEQERLIISILVAKSEIRKSLGLLTYAATPV